MGKIVDALLTGLYIRGLAAIDELLEADPRGSSLTPALATNAIESKGYELVDELMAINIEDDNYPGLTIEQYADALYKGDGPAQVERTTRVLRTLVLHEAHVVGRLVARARGEWGMHLVWKLLGQLPDRMARLRASLNMLQIGIHLDSTSKKKARAKKASVFGLESGIRPDFVYGVIVVGDLKFDTYHAYYDLVAAGYAIFAEYAFSKRVNTALLMFVDADPANPDQCEIRVVPIEVNNARRVAWSAQRDSALAIIALSSVPAHPTDVSFCDNCSYRNECWVGGEIGKPATIE